MHVEIPDMHRKDLLPGVTSPAIAPVVVQNSRTTLERARRRASLVDFAQLVLLVGVDVLFLRWPEAHLPTFNRGESLLILLAVNVVMLASIWVIRATPRWRAQRIARTWSPRERSRFKGK